MTFAVVIETKDRRLSGKTQNYLRTTLENFERAGGLDAPQLQSLTIVSGGNHPDFFTDQMPDAVFKKIGPRYGRVTGGKLGYYECGPNSDVTRQQNGARAIRLGAEQDADFVIKLEDDLDFCADFLGSVERLLAEFGGVAPIFSLAAAFTNVSAARFTNGATTIFEEQTAFPFVRQSIEHGYKIRALPVGGFWGAQAIVLQREWAQALADWLGDDPYFDDGKQHHRNRGHDLLLMRWCQQVGCRYIGVPVPAFVQHLGNSSNLDEPAIGHVQPYFQFPFGGREWRYA